MSEKYKIGIVGLGFRLGHVGKLILNYKKDAEIVSYADPNPTPPGLGVLEKAGYDAGKHYATLDEMLKGEDLDLLCIGSPNFQHLDDIRVGLEHGVRIFAEKPIVTDEKQTWELAELLSKYDEDSVLVGLVLRYSMHMKDVRRMLADGVVGEVTGIEGNEHIKPSHGAFFMRDWRRHDKYAGGFMLEKCCHDLDLYNMIAGSRPTKVASFGGRKTFVPENDPGANYNGDVFTVKPSGWEGVDSCFDNDSTDLVDYQTGLLQYQNGASLTFHTNLNVVDEQRRFFITGTKGTIEGDFIRGYIKAFDALSGDCVFERDYKNDPTIQDSVHYGADEAMVEDLFRTLLNGVKPPVSVKDAMISGLVAMKMDEARKTGKMVDLTKTWEKLDSYNF